MANRSGILAAIAAALPTDAVAGINFATVHRGEVGPLSDAQIPAALVRLAGEDIDPDQRGGQGSDGWAFRAMAVEVDIIVKHTTNLDDAMSAYAEAVEAAVLYDSGVAALVKSVLPDGYEPVEYDDESEQPVAQATVKLTVTYSHWPKDPATSPVADPYSS